MKDLEIICVNDGSTDSSMEIINKYVGEDSRFKVINKENSGYGDSLNQGIAVANGEYIGILESDDYVDSEMYEELYAISREYKLDFIKSDFYLTYGKNDKRAKLLDKRMYGVLFNPRDYPEILNCQTTNWSGIYRREFLVDNKIKHNTTPGASYQDTGFYFQICTLAKSCYFLDKAFYHYRQDNPFSSIHNPKKVYDIVKEYQFIRTNLETAGLFEEYKQIYYYKKFDAFFNFNYNRISYEYKQEFLVFMKDEFLKEMETGEIQNLFFSEIEWNVLSRIVKDPYEFYVNDLLWRLDKKGFGIHAPVKRCIKKSNICLVINKMQKAYTIFEINLKKYYQKYFN